MMRQKRLTLPVLPRQEEHATIRSALQQARDGSVQVVMIQGAVGTGRSSLAANALAASRADTGWMASTKFDQRGSAAPFASLRMLLADLTKSSLSLADSSEAATAIKKELDDTQLSLLMSFISSGASRGFLQEEREDVHEKKEDLSEPGLNVVEMSKDGLNVLTTSLKCFFRALSSVAPVVLLIEDLLWTDSATLNVLEAILTDPNLKRVFLCTTLQEVDPEQGDFLSWKERMEKSITSNARNGFRTIALRDLDIQQVQGLLSEATSLETDRLGDLTETVFSFTHGNLFHLRQFLEHLQDEELLKFDYVRFQWTWQLNEIRRRSCLSDNVVRVLTSRIFMLPQSTQNVLKLASCFGSQFDVRALDLAKAALDVDCVYRCLREACEQEFVIQLNETKYKFSHELIQFASYGLLPEELELQRVHFEIGSLLMKNVELLQDDDTILFTTVDHLNEGSEFIRDDSKASVAHLNYLAGTKAAALSAFAQAASYTKAGIAVLGPNAFELHYELALKLYQLCAKAEECLGEIDDARFYAEQVTKNASSWEEKKSSILVLMTCFKSENKIQELKDFCWGVLVSLGVDIPTKPSAMQVTWEYRKTKRWLKRMSEEDLRSLPPMTEITKDLALKILCELIMPLYQLGQPMMATLAVCRMIGITKNYGVSHQVAPEAFALAGIHLVYDGHNVSQGYKLGEVALSLLSNQGTKERNAHVSHLVAANLKWWIDPIPRCLDLLTTANKQAMEAGATNTAFQSIVAYGVNYFYSGLPLEPLLQDVEKYCGQFLQYNNVFFFLMGTPLWQCLNVLTGNCKDMEEGPVIDRLKSFDVPNIIGQQSLWCFSMQVAFYFGDLEKATAMAEKISSPSTGITKWSFFFALIHIGNYRLKRKRKDKSAAERIVELFRKLVKAGAINLVHKLQLLEAEMLTLSNKASDLAFQKYDAAIISASRAGFLQDAALANYLCFQSCKAMSVRLHLADIYLKKSFEQWISWGAVAVAESFVLRHSDAFGEDSVSLHLKDESHKGGSFRGRCRFDGALSEMHKRVSIVADSA